MRRLGRGDSMSRPARGKWNALPLGALGSRMFIYILDTCAPAMNRLRYCLQFKSRAMNNL